MSIDWRQIEDERGRQDEKWGGTPGIDRHDDHTYAAVLGEEFGEVCKAWLERDVTGLRTELVQTAAVCLAWIEELDNAGSARAGGRVEAVTAEEGRVPGMRAGTNHDEPTAAFAPPYRFEYSEHGPVTIYDGIDVGWIARVKESLPHKEALAQAMVDGLNAAAGGMTEREGARLLAGGSPDGDAGSIPAPSAMCPHARPDWRMCPHCNGLNDAVAKRLLSEHGETLRKLAEDD